MIIVSWNLRTAGSECSLSPSPCGGRVDSRAYMYVHIEILILMGEDYRFSPDTRHPQQPWGGSVLR